MAITITQEQLDALVEAYMSGATTVKIGDREIQYRSLADLLKAIKAAEAYLNPSAVSDLPSTITPTFSKETK